MAQVTTKDFSTLPVGRLGLIPLQSCSSLGAKVNDWLLSEGEKPVDWTKSGL